MKVGDTIIVKEAGPWEGQEGVIDSMPSATLKGRGFDISVPEEHQKATVKIYGGAIGIFVRLADLELKN